MKHELESSVIVAQYTQARLDIRTYDTMIWQSIAVILAVNGVLLGVIVSSDVEGAAAIIASVALILFTIPLTIALMKHRFFQQNRIYHAQRLLSQLGATELPFTTAGVMAQRELAQRIFEETSTSRNPAWAVTAAAALVRTPSQWAQTIGQHLPAFDCIMLALLVSHSSHFGFLIASIVRTR